MDFTERLKALKSEKNMTSKEIANLSGVPESTVSRIISKRTSNPGFLDVTAIVRALDGSLDVVAGLCPPKEKPESVLIKKYEKSINETRAALEKKDKQLRRTYWAFYILIAAIVALILLDVCVGTIGYIRH